MTVFAKVKADQSVNTVYKANTGGAGAKPLLGSANTVQRQGRVRVRVRVRLGQVRSG